MKRLRNILMTLGGVITTVFLLYTLAMVVFGICALCGVFSAVAEGSVWHAMIMAFVLGYLAVVAATGICVISQLIVLIARMLCDKEKGWHLLLTQCKWFAIGAVIGLAAAFIRYWINGSPSTAFVTLPLYSGMLSFWIFRWKNRKTDKNKDAGDA